MSKCLECGKEITLESARTYRRVTCSQACKNRRHSRQLREKNLEYRKNNKSTNNKLADGTIPKKFLVRGFISIDSGYGSIVNG